MKFTLTIKKGPETVAVAEGIKDLNTTDVTIADVQAIIPAEQLLERLTGLRFHIETSE